MRVVAIAPQLFSSQSCVTGDATQMRMTVQALRKISGVELDCLYYHSSDFLVSESGERIPWVQLGNRYDVAHVFAIRKTLYSKTVKTALSKLPSLLSTVYWNNAFREYIAVKNGTTKRFILRSFEYLLRRAFGWKLKHYEPWCIGILPNSWAEGDVFRKVHRLRPYAISIPVPNAIQIPENLADLARPDCVPNEDYIVCPGIFAPRKNQINLIRAMKGSGIPIVFLGQRFEYVPEFYDLCRKEADENMYFLGHIPSTDDKYWAILKYARVSVLTSDCETPGIAMLESAAAGARPVVPIHGGTQEYFGINAEYVYPTSLTSIRNAVLSAWERNRLTTEESAQFNIFSWDWTARLTYAAYLSAIDVFESKFRKNSI